MELSNAALLEVAIQSLPYPEQIENIDVTTSDEAIRFDWRGSRYRVSKRIIVEEVKGGCLCGTAAAMLMEQLFKRKVADNLNKKGA